MANNATALRLRSAGGKGKLIISMQMITIINRALLCLVLLLLLGCLGPVHELYPPAEHETPTRVLLISHGWHTGLILEREIIGPHLPDSPLLPQRRYLEFGWGDAHYYPHPDPGFAEMIRAALLPGPSVMHVVGIDGHPAQVFAGAELIELQLSPAGLERLGAFLRDTLYVDSDGALHRLGDGLYADGIFLAARGRYHLPRTSNTWTARALRAAGLPITPAYALTRANVMWQAGRLQAE